MKKFVLDTNVLLHIVRNSSTWQHIKATFNPLNQNNIVYVCIVSFAEVFSLAKRLKWGNKKLLVLKQILQDFQVVNVDNALLPYYIEIDTFSQGYHSTISLPKGVSARNMGKNDIWIAATALAFDATLLTTDKDFAHLQHFNMDVEIISL